VYRTVEELDRRGETDGRLAQHTSTEQLVAQSEEQLTTVNRERFLPGAPRKRLVFASGERIQISKVR